MKMTEKHREVLRLARQSVASGTRFICWALDRVGRARKDLLAPCKELKTEISRYLAPHVTLDNWQSRNDWTARDKNADRLAWIDWMLQQDEL